MKMQAKPLIASIYMDNVDPDLRNYQRETIKTVTFGTGMKTLQYKASDHARGMDQVMRQAEESGFTQVLFFDIDAIPLNFDAVMWLLVRGLDGLAGNLQRSNHIDNGSHLFVAPSCMCLTIETYKLLGRPSFAATPRGDVGEELSYLAEGLRLPINFLEPLRYEASPIEAEYWQTAFPYRNFGCQTTFGLIDHGSEAKTETEMTYHAFQIRHGRNRDAFIKRCKQILNHA